MKGFPSVRTEGSSKRSTGFSRMSKRAIFPVGMTWSGSRLRAGRLR